MNAAEKRKVLAAKERAIKKAEEARQAKIDGRKRGGYDVEELKQHWLDEFNSPTVRNKEHARVLKEKYYKDHTITVMAIYSRIWGWTKEFAEKQGVEVQTVISRKK